MKKALIYDPYFDTLGGGERYVLSFALALADMGFTVDFAWKGSEKIKIDAQSRFDLDLGRINLNKQAFHDLSGSAGLLARRRMTSQYDLVFWVSDGSIPFLFGKRNYIHIQVPFKNIGGHPFVNLFKTATTNYFIYNSVFTANVVRPQLPGSKSVILYPPIDVEGFVPRKKEDVILSVARFDSPSHAKRQDVLIDAFRLLHQKEKGYKLILAGGLMGEGGEEYLKKLREKAVGLPIDFRVNQKFSELKKLYSQAKIFWHAAGFGVDENEDPEKVEHFGMTTVEAMAAGAVPVVIDKGGQREIITKESGFLCADADEMVTKTLETLSSKEELKKMSQVAVDRAEFFSLANFREQIKSLL